MKCEREFRKLEEFHRRGMRLKGKLEQQEGDAEINKGL